MGPLQEGCKEFFMSTELELFNDDAEPITMSVKELSATLSVSADLIKKRIRELFPGKMKNGIQTLITEEEATAVELRIKENSSLATYDDRHRLSSMPKTDLEKKLIVQQALNILNEEIEILRPKAEKYDAFISAAGTVDMKEVAHILNIKDVGRNNLMKILRRQGVLNKNNHPYQNLIRLGYFKEVPVETYVGVKCKPVAYTRGVSFIKKAVDNFFEEGGEL